MGSHQALLDLTRKRHGVADDAAQTARAYPTVDKDLL
jgi:hypothetical protein